MSSGSCGIAAETKVETPEGALVIRTLAGKAVAVFTRDAGGRIRFRMMQNVRKVAEQQPVLKVTLETGRSFRVTAPQVLFKKGMIECRADALKAGDLLEPMCHYPADYRFHDEQTAAERVSTASLRVERVEPAGEADVYAFGVNHTGCFFVSAGVLCKADDGAAAPAS